MYAGQASPSLTSWLLEWTVGCLSVCLSFVCNALLMDGRLVGRCVFVQVSECVCVCVSFVHLGRAWHDVRVGECLCVVCVRSCSRSFLVP